METAELLACLGCIIVLSLSTVLCIKLYVRFHEDWKMVRYVVITLWLLIADETGQGMLNLSGALRGHPKAQAQLGLNYVKGSMDGTLRSWQLFWPKMPERGQFWLDKASASGDPSGDVVLAEAYMDGNMGLPKDGTRAAKYLKKVVDNQQADKQTRAEASYNLYQLFNSGDGVTRDPAQAFQYALISSDNGNGEAAYLVGKMYETGEAVTGDYAKAYTYYKRAVTGGYAAAAPDYERLKQELGQK